MELDADGCPISWEDADGAACEPPTQECARYNDCGPSPPAETISCIEGYWLFESLDDDCFQGCIPGVTAEGDSCLPSEDDETCALDGSGGDPCERGHNLICRDGTWHLQEAFPAPCGEAGAASGGANAGGASGTP